ALVASEQSVGREVVRQAEDDAIVGRPQVDVGDGAALAQKSTPPERAVVVEERNILGEAAQIGVAVLGANGPERTDHPLQAAADRAAGPGIVPASRAEDILGAEAWLASHI